MADLGIARPQDLLASLPGKLEPVSAVTRAAPPEMGKESHRQRPREVHPNEPPAEIVADPDRLAESVNRLNRDAQDYNLRFEVSDSNGRIIVHIVDRETGEVLRTVPPSAVIDLENHAGRESGRLIDAQT